MIDHDGQSSLASFKDLIPWFFGRSLLLSLPVIEAAQIRLIAHRLGALGAPEGTRFGTSSVLTGIKKNATDVMDEVEAAGVPVQFGPDHVTALSNIRDKALNANTPDTALANTISKLIGKPSQIDPIPS